MVSQWIRLNACNYFEITMPMVKLFYHFFLHFFITRRSYDLTIPIPVIGMPHCENKFPSLELNKERVHQLQTTVKSLHCISLPQRCVLLALLPVHV